MQEARLHLLLQQGLLQAAAQAMALAVELRFGAPAASGGSAH
jgi:hypothetical protein